MPIRPTLFAILLAATFQPDLPQRSSPSLKAQTQLVIVDVVVTDNKQNPVHNLTASDFTVLENNVPEHIKSFEEHTNASPAKSELPLVLPPGNFTNYTTVPADAPLNILLLDTLNTPNDAQIYVRSQIRLFLERSPPNVPLAIFGLSSRLWLLQPFTADPRLLEAAVDRKNPRTSPLIDNPATGGKTDRLSEKMVEAKAAVNPYVVQRLQQFEAEHSSGDLQLRARYTLDALNQLARYLAGLPGRKNLIWFSGSFPISILPDDNLLNPFAIAGDNSDKFRQTTALLAKSQVAVYPIDARGLAGPSVYSVESSGRQYDPTLDPNLGRNQDVFTNHLNDAIRQSADDNSTMLQMAEKTGGHAFINTNGLADAVARSIEAGSNYYTLTYSPTNHANDGKFRRIQLNLRRDGYTLAYRRGYYADAPAAAPALTPVTVSNAAPHLVPLAAAPTAHVADPMHNAMIFGSPVPTQITLKVLVVPAAGNPEATLASGNIASGNITGPYRRYDVTIAADPSAIIFTPAANDNHQVSLLFRTYVYSREGRLINTSSRIDDSDLSPILYERALHTGLFFHQEISVPVKGEFYLRIGVHDDTADHDGAVEIPVNSVKDLPPLTLPPVTQPLARRR
ncbi:VWA domain-containing protein [Granulicella sp. S190]|uniref:VWA domain-containing protein n=1 Tax=Granulicella sp. S190 TaxID=1747226 RepID=UPI00131BE168|nr:VWA domain-containing protein [Granulicella sp. S190]